MNSKTKTVLYLVGSLFLLGLLTGMVIDVVRDRAEPEPIEIATSTIVISWAPSETATVTSAASQPAQPVTVPATSTEAAPEPVAVVPTDRRAATLFQLINDDRAEAGLPGYRYNARLQKAAELKGADMAARGYFDHDDPEGNRPWVFLTRAGYDYASAGENLAEGFDSTADAEAAFMDSPTHRANVLKATYDEVGIALVRGVCAQRDTCADGDYGEEVTFVIVFFGRAK